VKVLFVGNRLSRPTDGGGDTFQRLLLDGLKRMRSSHECSFVAPEPNKGVLQALVAQHQIDFVWFTTPYYEPVEVPFATTVWDLGHRQLPWFPELSLSGWTFDQREQYYRHVLPRASLIVTGNASGARAVSEFYQVSPESICQIPLPVDAPGLQALAAEGSAIGPLGLKPAQYLFYPAQFWPHKNHITLVDALALLRASGRDLRLVFSGSDKGNQAHVQDYVTQRGLTDQVVFAGFVDQALLHQLYLNAFATVFSSLLGPDNLPPLEAMALGCPVVCAAYGGAHEQLGEAALFFAGLDAREAAVQVAKLQDAPLREKLIAAGRSLVQGRTPDEYVRRVSNALDGFASKRRLWGAGNSYRHPA
jgi:glycosyltransferase involved in cell wall biosynthesis